MTKRQIRKTSISDFEQGVAQCTKGFAIRITFNEWRSGFKDRVNEQRFFVVVIEVYLRLGVIEAVRA